MISANKGTKTLTKINIDRIGILAKSLSEKGIPYIIEIKPKTIAEYKKCQEEWAGLVEHKSKLWLTYLNVTIYKPIGESYGGNV